MSATLQAPQDKTAQSVSVGICAFNEEDRIGSALESLLSQDVPPGFAVAEVLVVASGCTDGTEAIVASWREIDARVNLLHQTSREGKASAINAFVAAARGDILVLLNADAELPSGSLRRLLELFGSDPSLQLACGLPVPGTGGSPLVRRFAEVQWGLHNRALETLDRLGLPNHCCDEFLAMRRGFVGSIPSDVINDGAYLAGVAEQQGQGVRICPGARVSIEVPRTLQGVLAQRRRILRGHRQVEKLLSRRPNTLEGLFFRNPLAVLMTVRDEYARNPRALLGFLLLLLPIEGTAAALAKMDEMRSRPYGPAWKVAE